MDVTYLKIKGIVGKNEIDLQIAIPLGDIIKNLPKILKLLIAQKGAVEELLKDL